MSNDVSIPENLGRVPTLFKERNIQTERLGDGLDGMGFSVVGAKGKEFYLRHKGRRLTLVNPPSNPPTPYDGQAAGYFDFVILRKAARKSHTYYKGGFQDGADERPTCVSTDGIAPDDNSLEKQSDLCEICPHYEWKRQPNGRDGRACADSLRLAVLPMPAQMKAVLGGDVISDPIMFRLPAASLKAFTELGDQMTKRFGADTPFCSYVVRATFKQGVSWPQFEYKVVRFLDPDGGTAEQELVLELRESPTAYRILGLTPEGNSLVRRGELRVPSGSGRLLPIPHTEPQTYQSAMGDLEETKAKLAAERAARIAAVRQPVTIEHQAKEQLDTANVGNDTIDIVVERPVPVENENKTPRQQTVPDTAADIDALVAAMRPRPPTA